MSQAVGPGNCISEDGFSQQGNWILGLRDLEF